MKKRTICLLLAMIMVLSIVLAGCSKTAETPAADETPATTEPAETTDNTETPEAPEETAEPALEQKTSAHDHRRRQAGQLRQGLGRFQ